MKTEKKREKLYQIRNFGDKFSATIEFINQTWKPMVRISLYLLLPFVIIQSAGQYGFFDISMRNIGKNNGFDTNYIVSLVLMVAGALPLCVLTLSLVYGMMSDYFSGEELQDITVSSLWPRLRQNIRRGLPIMLVGIAVAIILTGVVVLLFVMFRSVVLDSLLAIALYAAVLPVLSLWPAACMLNDDSDVFGSLLDAFQYGFKTWGSLFLLVIVMGIIVYAVSSLVSLPAIALFVVKAIFFPGMMVGNMAGGIGFSLLGFLLLAAGNFFSVLAYVFLLVGLGFHYGSAVEQIDNVSIKEDISNFDRLAGNGNVAAADDFIKDEYEGGNERISYRSGTDGDDSKRSDIDNFDKL